MRERQRGSKWSLTTLKKFSQALRPENAKRSLIELNSAKENEKISPPHTFKTSQAKLETNCPQLGRTLSLHMQGRKNAKTLYQRLNSAVLPSGWVMRPRAALLKDICPTTLCAHPQEFTTGWRDSNKRGRRCERRLAFRGQEETSFRSTCPKGGESPEPS